MVVDSPRHATVKASYADRAAKSSHPLTKYLFRLMELKQSNLCLSADVTSARELIHLADKIGPSIVVLKTHYDLVSGWDFNPQNGTGAKLTALARKHGFLIFEDRKFGDIGSTVQMQYTAGSARIIDWAHIVNVNMVPGKAAVSALAEAAAKWRSRVNYEVKTSVSVGTPVAEGFEDNACQEEEEEEADRLTPLEVNGAQGTHHRDSEGRKGSIVSITTVTQSFEPVDSPRLTTSTESGDDLVFAGIEEPPYDRGLLILAQMSSKGNFMNAEYTQACVEAAREHTDFVMGFISQESLNSEPADNFVHMTPGCQLPPEGEEENGVVAGDGLGQQYNTPSKLVQICGSDIIIVGRGIIKAVDPQAEAERYRRRGWQSKQKCDRKLPCGNCISRGKQASCRYETGTPLTKDHAERNHVEQSTSRSERSPDDSSPTIPMKAAADFGYSQNGASTLGFLKKIEGVSGAGESLSSVAAGDAQEADHFGSRERYKSLVRHLPARTFVDKLVDRYFLDFNWMYYGVDESIFRDLLNQWYNLPFHVLSSAGPQGIDPSLRSYPALLFQILATALLSIPNENDESFTSLKYAGSMTFEDLAMEYSETGVALLTLLGKRHMTVSTVLAGWVRASFLKYTGQVTEAWHQIGTAIRDAQEIGLHRDQFDPQPKPDDSTEAALEAMWAAEDRRRIWYVLIAWDLHTGAVLGRPTSVDIRTLKRTAPVDVIIPKDRRKTPIIPRGENDPPSPLTRSLWAFQIMRPLRDILDLEKEGPFPKDFSKVEKLHQELLDLRERTPPEFRLENPDTRYDDLPGMFWLPQVRPSLPQIMSFNFMALHRPYIFTRASSRHEALKASLDMLEAQRVQFKGITPQQYKTFSLFFGTFDAIVMMASIYILFPKEHPELLRNALQHFQWGVERFETMATHNRLAAAALGVLNAIYIRLKKAIGHGFLNRCCPKSFRCDGFQFDEKSDGAANLGETPSETMASSETSPNPTHHNPSIASVSGSSSILQSPETADLTPATTNNTDLFASPEWSFPTNFDFSTLTPMYPMGDLAYNDLTGIRDDAFGSAGTMPAPWPMTSAASLPGGLTGLEATAEEESWAFGGEFGNDTIWNLLNQIPPN
ncbi:humps family-domain-containing protein [Xylariales sp. PMI_506]|nr:humps family-domain-containing protein [Xylariales sp. PMI_506]